MDKLGPKPPEGRISEIVFWKLLFSRTAWISALISKTSGTFGIDNDRKLIREFLSFLPYRIRMRSV